MCAIKRQEGHVCVEGGEEDMCAQEGHGEDTCAQEGKGSKVKKTALVLISTLSQAPSQNSHSNVSMFAEAHGKFPPTPLSSSE